MQATHALDTVPIPVKEPTRSPNSSPARVSTNAPTRAGMHHHHNTTPSQSRPVSACTTATAAPPPSAGCPVAPRRQRARRPQQPLLQQRSVLAGGPPPAAWAAAASTCPSCAARAHLGRAAQGQVGEQARGGGGRVGNRAVGQGPKGRLASVHVGQCTLLLLCAGPTALAAPSLGRNGGMAERGTSCHAHAVACGWLGCLVPVVAARSERCRSVPSNTSLPTPAIAASTASLGCGQATCSCQLSAVSCQHPPA